MRVTVYGEGGFDPTKPNSNIIEERDEPDPVVVPDGLAAARATLAQSLDPNRSNPTMTERLDAVEQLLAAREL